MDSRTTPCGLGAANPAQQSDWTISFFLTYGSEAILPADIIWKSPRVDAYQEGEADEARQLELDSVEEGRIKALTQSARYLQGVRHYHDRNVQHRSFSIGDLVLCRIQDETGLHKFQMGGSLHCN